MSRDAICNVEGGELVIRITVSALAHGTVGLLTDADGAELVKVSNEQAWAESVANSLREEGETGETRITKMLDGAIRHAVEYGYDGIDYEG